MQPVDHSFRVLVADLSTGRGEYRRFGDKREMLGGSGLAALIAEQAQIAAARTGLADVREHFRQIWLDTGAAGGGSAAIAAAVRVLGADRIVFGSDFAPVPDIPPVIARVAAAVSGPEEADALFSGNARALLARFLPADALSAAAE